MIKILHILESFVTGGAENVVFELCRGLDPSRFESVVLAVHDGDMRPRFSDICHTELLPKEKGPDLRMLALLRDRIRALKVDVVHVVNGLTVVNYGVMASRLAGVPVVASVHGASHFVQPGLGPMMWRKMLKASDMRIAVSQDIRKRLERCLSADRPVHLVYNGIKEWSILPDEDFRNRCFCEWGISADAIVAVCVANLREIKGHSFLIEAVPRIVNTVPNFHLLLIGTGPLEATLREQVKVLNLRGHVHFAGLRNDVAACLALCNIFVLPSLSEGTPLCLLEAMRAGLPVVATRVGGIPEIVLDGVTGTLVPPKNSTLLAASISHLIENPEHSKKCAALGMERFTESFTLPLFLQRYSGLFAQACGS